MQSTKLQVPLIPQRPELPTGCEITAVTMMLRYAGADVNKVDLAKEMPYDDDDCNKGFVGNPFTEDGNSIYPPALMKLVKKYAGNAINLSGKLIDDLADHLSKTGHPIVVWVGQFDGFHTHALVVTGVDDSSVYYNDCWTNEKAALDKGDFVSSWSMKDRMALSY